MTTLTVEALSSRSFAPFGRVIEPPGRDPDAIGPGWRWWAETQLLEGDGRPWGVGLLDLEPAEMRFDWAERHLRTVEAVVATGADLLLYVGPPNGFEEPARVPALDRFRVFRIPAGRGVLLDRGVWHGAPLAAEGRCTALVLILEGTGRDDVTVVRFEDTPVAIDTSTEATDKE
ncbi:MAG TPA: ureidoglycolate lyase [Actinomycetota bacterium]|nr:ureidoglycolate lyase [Actinomycetota bacterium]